MYRHARGSRLSQTVAVNSRGTAICVVVVVLILYTLTGIVNVHFFQSQSKLYFFHN